MKKLILIGGGGHCRSCIDVIESTKQFEIVGILDHKSKFNQSILKYKIIGSDDDIDVYVDKGYYFIITIGQIETHTIRKEIYDLLLSKKANIATIISPLAYVSPYAKVEKGCIIMHHSIVNANARVLENCIINTKATIEHDSIIEAHCHISTGAIINGSVIVSEGTFFGSNSVCIQNTITKKADFIKAGGCYTGKDYIFKGKVAFLTTIYPINEIFVHEFMQSLSQQTYTHFDLIIINDGFENLSSFKLLYPKINIIELNSHNNIAKNRSALINYAKNNNYEILIFGDIDDKFKSNRVELSIKKLNEFDIIVNELTSFSGKSILREKIISSRIKNNLTININYILDKNILGLSNTAIKIKNDININTEFDENLIAVDWFFFSNLLLNGYTCIFTNETETYYRQHESNITGANTLTLTSLIKTLLIKKKHYEQMALINPNLYNERLIATNALIDKVKDAENANVIIEKNKYISPLWWEITE
ncbi:NeuD/PglB/VioB family sugar acetyltransferase [Providencia rettgeri]|uniref:NeuD/PglB/VioB family sugar acetyltransferase n=1 Tax=Providencia rettgeri TaxID=587 RepID=UPI0018E49985|nr:NeuD/PglB/VioB family sugar acetyltransferase [Providencia rettgeri]MBI6203901.1 NeuD/PglB/VioB family sugar acetyltransferase [Providencia rettgeri]HEP0307585.1 NeuD/PglB/VioB family sugar acetyltransferase [Providencia rettgeri]